MINEVVLPIGLFFMMMGLGLSITVEELIRASRNTRALFTALISMLVLVPIAGFSIARAFPLSTDLAMGLAILATCPGGIFSSYMTRLANGNVALSIALTTIVSIVYAFTATFWCQLALSVFSTQQEGLTVSPLETLRPLACFVVLPVVIGVLLNRYNVDRVTRHARWFRDLSAVCLLSAYGIILYGSRTSLLSQLQSCFLPVLTFNMVALLIAISACTIAKVSRRDMVAVIMENTIRQEGTGVYVASVLLGRPAMAFPLLLNTLIAQLMALMIAFLSRRANAREAPLLNRTIKEAS